MHLALQVRKTFDEKERGDSRAVEIVEQNRLVDAEAFEGRFVEKQRRTLRHAPILRGVPALKDMR